jgi:hypothetical protein
MPHQVILAAADGSTAAIAIHKAFVEHTAGTSQPRVGVSAVPPVEGSEA